jgi:hypothetical protein
MYCIMQYSQAQSACAVLHDALQIVPMKTDPKQKSDILQIRLTLTEKAGISQAAALAGISVSSWVRERLRLAAIRDLESAGLRVPFVDEIPLSKS